MASARAYVAVLGILFALAGLAVAWTVDQLTGLAVLLIGAFLLILPVTRWRDDE